MHGARSTRDIKSSQVTSRNTSRKRGSARTSSRKPKQKNNDGKGYDKNLVLSDIRSRKTSGDGLDNIKNANKLGLEFGPIPFSYKSGKDGREKLMKYDHFKKDPVQPDGLCKFQEVGREGTFNSGNMESRTTEFLTVLHKRLGYTKPGELDKIMNQYETNKRKY